VAVRSVKDPPPAAMQLAQTDETDRTCERMKAGTAAALCALTGQRPHQGASDNRQREGYRLTRLRSRPLSEEEV
jgi:hypothetical protein